MRFSFVLNQIGRAGFANIAAGVLVLAMGVGSVIYAHKNTRQTLDSDARSTAQRWYDSVIGDHDKMDRLAAGQILKVEERRRIGAAGSAGNITNYKVFSPDGVLLRSTVGTVVLSDPGFRAAQDAARRAASTGMQASLHEPDPESKTDATRVFIPAYRNGEVIAVAAPLVDQTEEAASAWAQFRSTIAVVALLTGTALCGTFLLAIVLHHQRLADNRIRHLASHDPLTGAANRSEFTRFLEGALAKSSGSGRRVALLMFDLDRFKSVNDLLGHAAGDRLLTSVSNRLLACVNSTDLVARLGGDEFATVVQNISGPNDAARIARRCLEAIRAIDAVGNTPVNVSASIGIAISEPGVEPPELQRLADAALYCAKGAGRDQYVVFKPGMDDTIRRRNWIRSLIRQAVSEEGFEIYYQPVHDARTGELKSFEALLRLPDGCGDYVSPTEFIPVAEDIGAATELGAWVMMEACKAATGWPLHIGVAVNLSPVQFKDDVPDMVLRALASSGLSPDRLELEITENVFIDDPERVDRQLREVKSLGVRVVMDDFGTGYSSLQHLWQFPFDKLKVDRSCFVSVDRSENVREILRTISAMSGAMKLNVTAEGIETESQRLFAEQAGYTEIQGFLYHRPMPSGQVIEYIEAEQVRQANTAHEPSTAPRAAVVAF